MELRKLLLVVNFGKEGALPLVEQIQAWGRARGIEVEVHQSMEECQLETGPGTVFLTLGGDGTFLRCANRLAPEGVPILGVNLGSLGFLTQIGAGDSLQALDQIRRGEFKLEERMMLEGRLGKRKFLALNDLVLSRPGIDELIEVELYSSGEFVARYHGDGLIIATPTGSSAYSLAAGGPVVDPRLELILATPLAPHTLGLRPIIFPPQAKLLVVTRKPGALLVDGDKLEELLPGDEVSITRSAFRIKMIAANPRPDFFALLQQKLNWGKGRGGG